MARNIARTLTAEELTRVKTARNAMPVGASVEFTYIKDNGETSRRGGTVIEFCGVDSTASVKIETDKGPRTFNLRNITVQ